MKVLLSILLLFLAIPIFAQQNTGDTAYVYYDYKGKIIDMGYSCNSISKTWPENGKWHQIRYSNGDFKLQEEAWYADKACTTKDGVAQSFYNNGMVSDSCLFVNNKKQGLEMGWDNEGNPIQIQKWHKGLPVDTAYWLSKGGKPYAIQVTDSNGNGVYRRYSEEGKNLIIDGRILAGQRVGKWTFKDNNNILSFEARYNADTVTTAICYDSNGVLETKKEDCKIEKTPAFPGGTDGWRIFLQKNLRYPDDAIKANVQGIVKVQFIVDKEGNASEFTIITSPYPSLSQEVLRIMKRSPKWIPAQHYNRIVIYRHIQSITFALE